MISFNASVWYVLTLGGHISIYHLLSEIVGYF
ncbi:hypothetical protein SAMN05216175_102256 [Neptunomonas qingdaonensis]|uniref:Uncharacterized protein n=1 Tax=Neptunomonas qingdaonensis TaxID=1045558 RepID=A0A1I2N3M0_9GAMM|nr:hypothetical protein SAMN05216175_102256 [Neptunomonas qingdaonensis]